MYLQDHQQLPRYWIFVLHKPWDLLTSWEAGSFSSSALLPVITYNCPTVEYIMYSTCEPLVWRYICSETGTALWAENLHCMQRVLLRVCCMSYTQNIVSCNLWHRHAFIVHTACVLCSVPQNLQFTVFFQQSTPEAHRFYINVGAILTHCGWVTQICVFNTVKLGTSASSP